jgi:monoamine oxidase
MAVEPLEVDCAVVGAGMSGLAAATRLHAAGLDTIVVEARGRVGGRAHTTRLDDGLAIDLGGQWRGIAHHRVARLGEAHGVTSYVQRVRGATIVRTGGRRVVARGVIPFGLGPATLGTGLYAMIRLQSMARRVPTDRPWAAPKAQAWDGQTFETWISRNVRSKRARSLFRTLFSGTMAADPSDVSLLHALVNLNVEGSARAHDLEGAMHVAQYASFEEGMQGLAERVAGRLGDRVRLGQPVRSIGHRADGVTIRTEGLSVEARRVVVAIPPTLAGRIVYDPPLPGRRDQLTQRVPQGSAIKCIAVYREPFWRDAGYSGLAIDDEGPVNFFLDATPPGVDRGVLIGFMGGGNARRGAGWSPEARQARALESFARGIGPAALDPLDYRDKDWSDEAFTRGCYSGSMPPGAWTSYGPALREPVGTIHWAGTETARECVGLYEGALEAGERAADEVIDALTR